MILKKWFENISKKLTIISEKPLLLSIREGFLVLLPYTILLSTALLVSNFFTYIGLDNNSSTVYFFENTHLILKSFFSIFMVISISFFFGKNNEINQVPCIFICLISFLIFSNIQYETYLDDINKNSYWAIPSAILPIIILKKILKFKFLPVVKKPIINKSLQETLNLILPVFFVISIIILVNYLLIQLSVLAGFNDIEYFITAQLETILGLSIFVLIEHVFWFFGIHGYNALLSINILLNERTLSNQAASEAGLESLSYFTSGMLDSFVYIGGSGTTFALIITILLFSKNKYKRTLAFSSLPMTAFNINEIIIYGLPIIFNPIFLFPFVFVPVLITLITFFATYTGFIPIPTVSISWMTPPILNAYLSCNGSVSAVLFQILMILLGVLCYWPFVRLSDKVNFYEKSIDEFAEVIELEKVSSQYDEIAAVQAQLSTIQESIHIRDMISELSTDRFLLYFQPIVNMEKNKIEGFEALLRYQHPTLGLKPPDFTDALEKIGLMADLDYWVVRKTCEHAKYWHSHGLRIWISINLTPSIFQNPALINLIEKEIDTCPLPITLELTETNFTEHKETLTSVIKQLKHKKNTLLAIDDFGIGSSSLARLRFLDADVIKIDKSFVNAINQEKGELILQWMISLCNQVNTKCIVEGIETDYQKDFVLNNGANYVQGFLISHPVPSNEVENLVAYWDKAEAFLHK